MFKYYISIKHYKGDTFMATSKDNNCGHWEKQAKQIEDLTARVSRLSETNSRLLDEVATLKSNHNRLVEDMSVRLEAVHKKLFR